MVKQFNSRWKWLVPIGQSLEQLIYHDFDKTPHMTLGGLTRMGKDCIPKECMTSLITAQAEYTHLFIIDLKGGLEFGYTKCKTG